MCGCGCGTPFRRSGHGRWRRISPPSPGGWRWIRCDYNRAAQRRSDLTLAFDELEGCLSGPDELRPPWSGRTSGGC